jgi:hypothetical protein
MIYTERKNDDALDGQSAYVWKFPDAAEAATHLRANLRMDEHKFCRRNWDTTDSWTGGKETPEQAITRAKEGNDALVALAQETLSKIESGGLNTQRAEWLPSACGAYPCVPEAIAGRPDPMRRRMDTEGERHPIRVIMDTTSSAGIDARDLEKRGAAVLAFVMALAQERPVELWQITTLDAHGSRRGFSGLMVRLPTAPMHLGICAHLLTSQVWTRNLGYGWLGQEAKAGGAWAWGDPPQNSAQQERYDRLTRAALDMDPQDVFVQPIVLSDPLTKDPVGWINNQLARIRGMQEEYA